jgi:phage recombination protein Bet
MNQMAPLPPQAAGIASPRQLDLIRRTVAKDCSNDEFDLYIHAARRLGLDPLRRQVYAFVHAGDDPKRRRLTIVTGIDGFRTIAERTGTYRPDENEPRIKVDAALKSPTNPAGLVKATVRVFKFSHGAWHKVTASAHWDEYVPLRREWAEDEAGRRQPTGGYTLDPESSWARRPRLMLAKVAEAQALRKAWPDAFSSLYAHEEVEHMRMLDGSPSDLAELGACEKRLERIGGADTILMQWEPGSPLEPVRLGALADRALAFVAGHAKDPATISAWRERNRHGLREFWARAPSDALALKQAIEKAVGPEGAAG